MVMGIDQETGIFLKKIVNTISAVLVWMILHVVFGLYYQYGLFETSPNWINLLYYSAFIVTLFLLVFILKRIWKT
jgi:uncharacterized membrane protein (DUF373 family)